MPTRKRPTCGPLSANKRRVKEKNESTAVKAEINVSPVPEALLDSNSSRRFCYVARGINRTFLTVNGPMVKELLQRTNKTGKLSKKTLAEHLKPYHREKSKGFKMRQAVLRGDCKIERKFGCGKCRWTPKGCARCRAPGFKLGPKEGLSGVGIPRPGSENKNMVEIGKIGDSGGVKFPVVVTSNTPICKRIQKMTKGARRGYGLVAGDSIRCGAAILEFAGELLTHDQAGKREEFYAKEGIACCYQMKVNRGLCSHVIDPTLYGNAARFVNSSCSPNMVCKRLPLDFQNKAAMKFPRPMFYAMRDIQKGEELTWRYSVPSSEGEGNYSGRTSRSCSRQKSSNDEDATTQLTVVTRKKSGEDGNEGSACFCGAQNCHGQL